MKLKIKQLIAAGLVLLIGTLAASYSAAHSVKLDEHIISTKNHTIIKPQEIELNINGKVWKYYPAAQHADPIVYPLIQSGDVIVVDVKMPGGKWYFSSKEKYRDWLWHGHLLLHVTIEGHDYPMYVRLSVPRRKDMVLPFYQVNDKVTDTVQKLKKRPLKSYKKLA